MALHTGPKLLLCAMYHRINASREQFKNLASLTSFLSLLELVSLLMVSVVPSIELYNLHIIATGVFLVCSALHMSLSFYLTLSVRIRSTYSFDRKIFAGKMLGAVYSRWGQIIFNYENLFIINRWDTRSNQDFL